jgi:molecular chaperone GrpE
MDDLLFAEVDETELRTPPRQDEGDLEGEAVAESEVQVEPEVLAAPENVEVELAEDVPAEIVEVEPERDPPQEAVAEAALDDGYKEVLMMRISEIEEELSAAQDRLLRMAADYENFKRRSEREREDLRRYGSEKLLTELLPGPRAWQHHG